jgi:hypothetical protein
MASTRVQHVLRGVTSGSTISSTSNWLRGTIALPAIVRSAQHVSQVTTITATRQGLWQHRCVSSGEKKSPPSATSTPTVAAVTGGAAHIALRRTQFSAVTQRVAG